MAALIICDTCGLGKEAKEAKALLKITRNVTGMKPIEISVDLCFKHFNMLLDALPYKQQLRLKAALEAPGAEKD